jgi:hypothetical protein
MAAMNKTVFQAIETQVCGLWAFCANPRARATQLLPREARARVRRVEAPDAADGVRPHFAVRGLGPAAALPARRWAGGRGVRGRGAQGRLGVWYRAAPRRAVQARSGAQRARVCLGRGAGWFRWPACLPACLPACALPDPPPSRPKGAHRDGHVGVGREPARTPSGGQGHRVLRRRHPPLRALPRDRRAADDGQGRPPAVRRLGRGAHPRPRPAQGVLQAVRPDAAGRAAESRPADVSPGSCTSPFPWRASCWTGWRCT